MTSGLQKKIPFSLLDLSIFCTWFQHHNKYKMISSWLVRVVKFPDFSKAERGRPKADRAKRIYTFENSEEMTIFLRKFSSIFSFFFCNFRELYNPSGPSKSPK